MKKNLLAVFVLWFATLLLAGCNTNTPAEDVIGDETVAEEEVVVAVEVVAEEVEEAVVVDEEAVEEIPAE